MRPRRLEPRLAAVRCLDLSGVTSQADIIATFYTGQDFTSAWDSLKLNRQWESYCIRERSRIPGGFEPEPTLRHTYSS